MFRDATFIVWSYQTSYGEDFHMEMGKFYKPGLLLLSSERFTYLHINSASSPTWSLGTQLLWFQILVVTWLVKNIVMTYVHENSTKEVLKASVSLLKALCPR